MKTSNKILAIYGAALAVFTFASLGVNVAKYRAVADSLQLSADAFSAPVRVVVVDKGQAVKLFSEDNRKAVMYLSDSEIATARVSGDTLVISGKVENLLLPEGLEVIER